MVGQEGIEKAYYSAMTMTNVAVLVELSFKQGFQGCQVRSPRCCGCPRNSHSQAFLLLNQVNVRTDQPAFAAVCKAMVETILRTA